MFLIELIFKWPNRSWLTFFSLISLKILKGSFSLTSGILILSIGSLSFMLVECSTLLSEGRRRVGISYHRALLFKAPIKLFASIIVPDLFK